MLHRFGMHGCIISGVAVDLNKGQQVSLFATLLNRERLLLGGMQLVCFNSKRSLYFVLLNDVMVVSKSVYKHYWHALSPALSSFCDAESAFIYDHG